MTDKQIIIDNVDVSGCESFCNGICCKVGFGGDASCELFSDCNYKNWKRKEQECEELKKLVETHCTENINMQRENGLLQEELAISIQENEEGREINAELKEKNEELNKLYEEVCSENLKEIYELIKKNDLWRGIVNVVNEKLEEQLDQLKAENKELTTINARLLDRLEVDETDTSLVFNLDKELRQKEREFYVAIQEIVKLEQALKEIKPILEFYANSKIGEKQGNGTYKILLNGGCILNYDPKPARQALQKISEVEDVENN